MPTIKQLIVLFVCFVFMASGAVNQGISGFLFAIPFAIIFLYFLNKLPRNIAIVSIAMVVLLLAPLAWKHSENKLIYPAIGEEFKTDCNWDITNWDIIEDPEMNNSVYIRPNDVMMFEGEKKIGNVGCDSEIILVRVMVSHADMGLTYYPIFKVDNKEVMIPSIFLDKALEDDSIIHDKISSSDDLQSKWTKDLSSLMIYPVFFLYFLVLILKGFSAIKSQLGL